MMEILLEKRFWQSGHQHSHIIQKFQEYTNKVHSGALFGLKLSESFFTDISPIIINNLNPKGSRKKATAEFLESLLKIFEKYLKSDELWEPFVNIKN